MGQTIQRITPESDDMAELDAEANFSPLSASVMRHRDGLANAAGHGRGAGAGAGGGGGGSSGYRETDGDDLRSIHSIDDDQVVTCHAFLENPALGRGSPQSSRKDIFRSVTQLADTFETFEFMLDTCVASVNTYGVGFSDDFRHQILKLSAPSDKLMKEEEYRRGLITNSMLTMSQIILMAAAQVMPALVAIQSVEQSEVAKFKRQISHRGRAGSFIAPHGGGGSTLSDGDGIRHTATVTIFNRDLNIRYRRGGSAGGDAFGNGNDGAYSPANSMSLSRAGSPAYPSTQPPTAAAPAVPDTRNPKMVEFFSRLSGASIDAFKYKAKAKVIPNWNMHLSEDTEKSIEHFNRGDAYFHFLCSPLTSCNNEDLTVIQTFANVSSFEDEMRDNNCPVVDVFDEDQKPLYQVIGVKAMYILPGIDVSCITKELMATQAYNKACQPGDCKFFDVDTPLTFRQTKCVVKFVYTITVQFLVGEINEPSQLEQFTHIEGVRPDKAIFLERTKRNVQKTDSTAKVRSVLLYYNVDQGVFVGHHTVVMSTSIPSFVAKIVNNFGSQGAAESAETADLTRRFLLKQFGDTRK